MADQVDYDNLDTDIANIGKFVNDPAGTVAPRVGASYPNLRQIILDLSGQDIGESAAALINQRLNKIEKASITVATYAERSAIATEDLFYGLHVYVEESGLWFKWSNDFDGLGTDGWVNVQANITFGQVNISDKLLLEPFSNVQEWRDFMFAFTIDSSEGEVAILGFNWDGTITFIPNSATIANFVSLGIVDNSALNSAINSLSSTLSTLINANYNLISNLERNTAKVRRENLNQETYGEPETLLLDVLGAIKLLRQVDEAGLHYIPGGIKIDAAVLSQTWRDFMFALTLKRGNDEVAPFAVDWDGLLELYPNDATFNRIKTWLTANGGSGSYLPLSDLRGNYSTYPVTIWPIGTKSGQKVAQVQDRGGQVYRAFERTAGTTSLAVIEDASKMEAAIYLGQSTAGKSGDELTIDLIPHWPSTVISFATANQFYGTGDFSASTGQTELGVLKNFSGGQLPQVATEFALAQLRCDFGRRQKGTFVATAWHGSQSLVNLDRGGSSYNYANSLRIITEANTLIQNHERTGIKVKRIWLSQGENSSAAGWQTDFNNYKSHYVEDIPGAQGSAFDGQFFISQTNTIFGFFNANWQGQNAVHDAGAAIMTSSCINLPLSEDDNIHPSAIGTLIRGDQDAHAIACWERDGSWNPPREISATLSGTTLTLRVQMPRDTVSFGKVLDKMAPPQQPQDGFVVAYDGGNTTAINSVTYSIDPVTSEGVIVFGLAGVPGSNPRLKYGIDNDTDYSAVSGAWASRTGNVFCTTWVNSFWHRVGFDVPSKIRQPLRRFQINIT